MKWNAVTAKKKQRNAPLFFFAFFFCLLGLSVRGRAALLENVPTVLEQPDGGAVSCYSSGDEYFNYLHDAGGALIVQDGTGWYTYAEDRDGYPAPSNERVPADGAVRRYSRKAARMTADDVDLAAYPELTASFERETVQFLSSDEKLDNTDAYLRSSRMQSGDRMANIVIFLRFQGEEEFVRGTAKEPSANISGSGQENGEQLDFFQSYQKVRQYFNKISDGTFETDTVFLTADPAGETMLSYEDSHPRSYYQARTASNPEGYSTTDQDRERTQREMELLENALQAVLPSLPKDALLDRNRDGKIDNITFICSGSTGGWNQILWPHSWALQRNEIKVTDASGEEKLAYNFNLTFSSHRYAGVGVLSHELLHTVGFPDLYRYNDSGTPVGGWDVMGTTDYDDPQFPGAYLADAYAGWGNMAYADASGVYTLRPVGTDDGSPDGYFIPTGNPNEYLVAEYRKNGAAGEVTRDNVPRDGLLVYRANKVTSSGDRNGTAEGGDEVYIFRPEDAKVNAGTSAKLAQASLSSRWNAAEIGTADGAAPAQSTLYGNDGVNTRIVITEVTENSDGTVSFRLTLPEEENRVEPGTYDLSQRDYTISSPGEYRFTGTACSHQILVAANAADVTVILDNVDADLSGTQYGCPVYLRRGAQAKLVLEGENRLTGGAYEAAVHVSETASLTVTGSGSLEAYGGGGAAAIGGNAFEPAGNIAVSGGALTLHGGGSYTVQGTAASLTGGAAPALGAGAGRYAGNIRLENAELELFGGVGDGGAGASQNGIAVSTCALPEAAGQGGDISIAGCTVYSDGTLWAGRELTCTDSKIRVHRKAEADFGCLEAQRKVLLENCETELQGGPHGFAVGGGNRKAAFTVQGGTFWAASPGYTVCAASIAFDDTARVFLSSGETETLFSGIGSDSSGKPFPVQPGMPAGAAGRGAFLQGTLEQALTADYRYQLYRDGQRAGSQELPAGCRTFTMSVPGAGEYRLRDTNGGYSEPASIAAEGVTRVSPLLFIPCEDKAVELDASQGPVSITESGEYRLTGQGTSVKVAGNIDVTLRLQGVELNASSGQAAVSAGAGGSLTLLAEEGLENRLRGGLGKPGVEAENVLSFAGDGELLVLGGEDAPAVTARSVTAERDCRLLLVSSEREAVQLTGEAEASWHPGYGQAPILLFGSFQKALYGQMELTFRGSGDLETWELPYGPRSFCKTLSGYGDITITTSTVEESPTLSCREERNVYEDIPLERWNNATRKADLSGGNVTITENGVYALSGVTNRNTVKVADGVTATLRLEGAQISIGQGGWLSGCRGLIELGKNCSVTVVVSGSGGESLLANRADGSGCAVIYVPRSSRLALDLGREQELQVIPGRDAPLFGVPEGEEAGEIVFTRGTVRCVLPENDRSEILVGGKNASVILEQGRLEVSGGNTGAVGGPNSHILVSGGALTLSGGLSAGTLGGENSLVEIAGGELSLQIDYGDIGIGGRNAAVSVSGGSVKVSDVQAMVGGMRSGIGGPGARVRLTGGEVQVDSAHASNEGWGALGGPDAKLYLNENACAAVRMKQRGNSPLAADGILEERTTGGFVDVRLAAAFQEETEIGFTALPGGEETVRSFMLPPQYYGFFAYLPAGVWDMVGPAGSSAGAAEIQAREITGLTDVAFDRLPGVWLGNGSVQYDGAPHSLRVSGTLPEDAVVSYEGNVQTLPGSYPVTALVTHAGGSYSLTATLTVTKAPLTVTGAVARDKALYDGSCATDGSLRFTGAVGGEQPVLSADFRFETADVGENKPVSVTDLRLAEEGQDRYYLTVQEGALDHVTASILAPARGSVFLEEASLLQPAGHAVEPVVATKPAGLPVRVTYDGNEELPQAAGTYAVEAVILGGNYEGRTAGTLVLAETLNLSRGDAVISGPGSYVVTGSTDTNRIVVQGDALDGGITLALQDVEIRLTEPGAVPLEVRGTPEVPGAALKLFLPEGTHSVLQAGARAPALVSPGMEVSITGAGQLAAYGGEGAEAAELGDGTLVSSGSSCQFYSTLETQTAPFSRRDWALLSFAQPATETMELALYSLSGEKQELLLPQGYRSLFVSKKDACILRNAEGVKLCYLPSSETEFLQIPFHGKPAVEQSMDISDATMVRIMEDGIYRITGLVGDGTMIGVTSGVDATLILDHLEVGRSEGTNLPFVLALSGSHVTVRCETDSRIDVGAGTFIRQTAGGSVRLEGPGKLSVSGTGGRLFEVGILELANELDITAGSQTTVFEGGGVSVGPDAKVSVLAAGTDSVVFGADASLSTFGGAVDVELAGEGSCGFLGIDAALSGDARVSMRLTGPGTQGVDLSTGRAGLALEGNASLTAYTAREDAECLRGGGSVSQRSAQAALFCGTFANGGLTAVTGDRAIQAESTDYPGWTSSLTLPQLEAGAYRSILMLLPGAGDYEFQCTADSADTELLLTAQALGVEAGAAVRPLEFQVLSQLAGLELESGSFVYDGTEKSLWVSGLPAGASVSYSNNGQREPGVYPVTALVQRPGFRSSTLTRLLTIEKRPLTVQAAADDKEVYDGTAETTGTVRLGNAVLGDAPTATASFIFDSPDVGVNKTVHVTGIRLAEDENHWAAHYVLQQDTATVQASIRKKQRVELRLVEDSLVQEYGSVTGAVADGPEDAGIVTRYAGKEELPVLPGEYEVQAALEDRNRFGSVKGCFTVRPKQVSIQGLLVPEIDEAAENLDVFLDNSLSFDRESTGILAGDEVCVSGAAHYPDSAPGDKTVAVTGLTLSGAQADRYALVSREAQGMGTVRKSSSSGGNNGGGTDVPPGGGDEPDPPDVPDDPPPEDTPFRDIAGHWAREDILAVWESGLMTGTSEDTFEPREHMTRAMLTTVLCRMAGADPLAYTGSPFTDVPEGSWYAPYVQWAAEEGLTTGMEGGTFHPKDAVSREQLAVFLFRFAQYSGLETPEGPELLFPDSTAVSDWALEGMRWAVEQGILNGREDSGLDPRGTATRAEVAAMLRRYLKWSVPDSPLPEE